MRFRCAGHFWATAALSLQCMKKTADLFAVITLPKYRRPNPHHCRAFLYGGSVIAAHAHGKFGEVFESEARIAQFAQAREAGTAVGLRGWMGADGHEAAQAQGRSRRYLTLPRR